jgi:hypothetical protein
MSFTVSRADGIDTASPVLQVSSNGSTLFQGVSAASQLVAGMTADMDLAIQADGSLLATRVAVYDTDTSYLNTFNGPADLIEASLPQFAMVGQEQQGYLNQSAYYIGGFVVNSGSAVFQTSGTLANLQSLPFAPSFTAANMVDGQNVSITSHVSSWEGNPLPVATITLMPQTIDGTVSAVSSEGNFTTYTVTLAGYDLFPDLAEQKGQTTLLTNPRTVVIYADSNTQMLNTAPVAVGSLLRFHGLVFNDNGTLRMDCAQVNNGVTE